MSTIAEQLEWHGLGDLIGDAIEKRDEAFKSLRRKKLDHEVRVEVPVTFADGFCMPSEDGEALETAVFERLTFGDTVLLDILSRRKMKIGERQGVDVTGVEIDVNEYRRLMLMRKLKSWTLDIPVEKDADGWMTDGCWERVARLPAPLVEAFVAGYEETGVVTDEEEVEITKQCINLFSKSGGGVKDACEAILKFCAYGNFHEKFGLDVEAVNNLGYRDYQLLRMIIGKENDSFRSVMNSKSQKSSSMVTMGGRTRMSRGKRQALPGSN